MIDTKGNSVMLEGSTTCAEAWFAIRSRSQAPYSGPYYWLDAEVVAERANTIERLYVTSDMVSIDFNPSLTAFPKLREVGLEVRACVSLGIKLHKLLDYLMKYFATFRGAYIAYMPTGDVICEDLFQVADQLMSLDGWKSNDDNNLHNN